jgi:hypothetical protein
MAGRAGTATRGPRLGSDAAAGIRRDHRDVAPGRRPSSARRANDSPRPQSTEGRRRPVLQPFSDVVVGMISHVLRCSRRVDWATTPNRGPDCSWPRVLPGFSLLRPSRRDEACRNPGHCPPMTSTPLTWSVTVDSGSPQTGPASTPSPRTGPVRPVPTLTVRVRFSSPAPKFLPCERPRCRPNPPLNLLLLQPPGRRTSHREDSYYLGQVEQEAQRTRYPCRRPWPGRRPQVGTARPHSLDRLEPMLGRRRRRSPR